MSDEVRWRHGQTSICAARPGRCIRCDPSPDPRGGPRDPRARTSWRPQGRRGGASGRRLPFDRVPPLRLAGRAVRRAGAPSPRHGWLRRAGGLEPVAGRATSDPDLVPDRGPHVRPDAAPRAGAVHARRDRSRRGRRGPGDRGWPAAGTGPPRSRARGPGLPARGRLGRGGHRHPECPDELPGVRRAVQRQRARRGDRRRSADRDGRALAVPGGPAGRSSGRDRAVCVASLSSRRAAPARWSPGPGRWPASWSPLGTGRSGRAARGPGHPG